MNILLKLTDRCNNNCTYCYEKHTRNAHGDMKVETFKKLVSNLHPHDNITYHGGEPVLIGIETFRVMQDILKASGFKGTQSMQTSGINLSDEWVNTLLENGISCSVSMDFTKERDNQITLENIQRLIGKNLIVAVLVVVHQGNISNMVEMYEDLVGVGVQAMAFNLVYETSQVDPEIHKREFTKFYTYLINQGDIRERNMLQHYSNYKGMGYEMSCSPKTCIGNLATVLPNGDVYPCDRVGARKFPIGTVKTLDRAFEGANYKHYKQSAHAAMSTCNQCDIKTFCHGSCVFHHDLMGGKINEYECRISRNYYEILNTIFKGGTQ